MRLKKNFLAVLAAAMVFMLGAAILPEKALATPATPVCVYVGNTRLEDGESTAVYGGTASYSGGVLTLNGVTVSDTLYHTFTNTFGSYNTAVYADGDLTINLVGISQVTSQDRYGIYITGKLTVQGTSDSSLTGIGGNGAYDSIGVYADRIEVTSGNLIGKSRAATRLSYAVYCEGGIIVSGGSLTGESNTASSTPQFSTGVYCMGIVMRDGSITGTGSAAQTSNGVNCYGTIDISGGSLSGTGGTGTSLSYGVNCNGAINVSGGSLLGTSGTGTSGSYGVASYPSGPALTGNGEITAICLGTWGAIYRLPSTNYFWKANTEASAPTGGYRRSRIDYCNTYGNKYLHFKADPAEAAIEDVTVSGTTNEELSPVDIALTLTEEQFNAIAADTDVSGWFIDRWSDSTLPIGVSAKIKSNVAQGGTTAMITVFGTPSRDFNNEVAIFMPADALMGGFALPSNSNENAVWNISTRATVTPATETFSKDQTLSNYEDKTFRLTEGSFRWDTIMLDGTQLASDELDEMWNNDDIEYVDDPSAILFTFRKEKLADLAAGSHTITFVMDGCADLSVTLAVMDRILPASDGEGTPPASVTIYNDPNTSQATVWLTGKGLTEGDLLITEPLTSGESYNAMLRLADKDDIFKVYNIHLRSARKSTGSAMYLHFDLNAKYAGQTFTLVHKKADGTTESFYATADANGDFTFGPLDELSPFMLVKGMLTLIPMFDVVDIPKTGDDTMPGLWAGVLMIFTAGLSASTVSIRRRLWKK